MLEEYENFSCSEFQIKTFVANLRYSHNTIIGSILLLKSLVTSRFIYKLILLPMPPLFLKFLQNLYYTFIWNYKNPRIARTTMEQDFSKGGFRMLNVVYQNYSLKFIWLHRLLNTNMQLCFWQFQIHEALAVPIEDFLQFNLGKTSLTVCLKDSKLLPEFWCSLFRLWFQVPYVSPKNLQASASDILQLPVCFNTLTSFHSLKWGVMLEYYHELQSMGIFTIEQFLRKKDTLNNFAVRWLPIHWLLLDVNSDLSATLYHGVVNQKWSAKAIYQFFRDRIFHPPTAIRSWSKELTNPLSEMDWFNSFKKASVAKDIRLRSFHLTFINHGYYLNSTLAKFTDVAPECPFCEAVPDSYLHIYWYCQCTSELIGSFQLFCEHFLDVEVSAITRDTFIFSTFHSPLLVTLTMLCKKYVHGCLIYKTQPNFTLKWIACKLDLQISWMFSINSWMYLLLKMFLMVLLNSLL